MIATFRALINRWFQLGPRLRHGVQNRIDGFGDGGNLRANLQVVIFDHQVGIFLALTGINFIVVDMIIVIIEIIKAGRQVAVGLIDRRCAGLGQMVHPLIFGKGV